MANEDLEKQIFDVILSTNKDSNLDISYRFAYNTYSTDERTINDNIIFDSGKQKRNRYIEITSLTDIQNFSHSDGAGDSYNIFYDYEDDDDTVKSIVESLGDLNGNISEQEIIYFNNICDYDTEKLFFYNQTKTDDPNIMDYYRVQEGEISSFYRIQNNSKSFVKREESSNILNSESNHFIPSENEVSILLNYNDVIQNEEDLTDTRSEVFLGNLLGNFVTLASFLVDDIDSINTDSTKLGLLITKYEKIQNEYIKKSDFLVKGVNESSYSFSLKDDNIIYGKTYLYRIQEVFLYRKRNDAALDYYLFCGYPFFTEDILCEETKNPEPPIGLSAEYNIVNNEFRITWGAPTNDQNDAKGYQILKRESLEEPYTVISQIENHLEFETFERKENILDEVIEKKPGKQTNYYVDKTFKNNKVQIYAVRTIDAHGNLSLYSSQIAILYNKIENNLIVDLISKPKAPIEMPNLLIPRRTILFENESFSVTNLPISSDIEKVTLYVTPEFVNISNNETSNNSDSVLGEKYKFTMTKLNTLDKYESIFKIKNFGE